MEKLRERYGDDQVKMQQEMMALYKREKVNPVAGCLPIVMQIPVFFSLYKVLFVTIEMRHAPFFGWIQDLSAPDPTNLFNLFGLIPCDPPQLSITCMIGVWPLIMGVTMFLQQKLNPHAGRSDPGQDVPFMPVIFTFMLATFPAGLVIYWTWNNLLSIAQQWVIMTRRRRSASPRPDASGRGREARTPSLPVAPPGGTAPSPTDDRAALLEAGRRLFAQACDSSCAACAEARPAAAGGPARRSPSPAARTSASPSLVNALTGRNALARASNTPGRTQEINFFDLGEPAEPGGPAGLRLRQGAQEREGRTGTELIFDYLRGRPSLRRVLLLIDARHGLKPTDRVAMALLTEAAVPFQIVLTKADHVRPGRAEQRIAEAARNSPSAPAGHPAGAGRPAPRPAHGIAELRAAMAALRSPSSRWTLATHPRPWCGARTAP